MRHPYIPVIDMNLQAPPSDRRGCGIGIAGRHPCSPATVEGRLHRRGGMVERPKPGRQPFQAAHAKVRGKGQMSFQILSSSINIVQALRLYEKINLLLQLAKTQHCENPLQSQRLIISFPASHRRIISSPASQRRTITFPASHRRTISSPASQRRIISSPASHRRIISFPASQRRTISSPASQRRTISSPCYRKGGSNRLQAVIEGA